MRDAALNKHAPFARWAPFDRGRWLDFNPTVARLPDGRRIAVVRRDAVPPVPGKGTLWWVEVDAALAPVGTPQPLLARGEDPRAVMLGERLLVFYCVIDRDADDRVCGSTMMLAEFALEGRAFTAVAHFQLPKNPVGLARPGTPDERWEKNWVPFAVSATEVALVYAHAPWHVLVLDCDPARGVRRFVGHHAGEGLRWRHGEIRGGTPPLPYVEDGRADHRDAATLITFFHASAVVGSRKVYTVGACTFDRAAPFTPRRMTADPLVVAPYNSGAHRHGWMFAGSVVFPLGADRCDGGYRLLCGLDDGEVAVFTVGDDALAERLRAIEPATRIADADGHAIDSAAPLVVGPAADGAWPLARLLELLAGRGRTFVDWGAGDGAASIALAPGHDRVVAYEGDAGRRRCIARSAALNGDGNVRVEPPPATLDAAALDGVDALRIAAGCADVLRGAAATIARDRPLLLLHAGDDDAALDWLAAAGYDAERLHVHHPRWCVALPRERRAAWRWFY